MMKTRNGPFFEISLSRKMEFGNGSVFLVFSFRSLWLLSRKREESTDSKMYNSDDLNDNT